MTTTPARPTQRAFARALLDPACPPPSGLCTWNGSDPGPRLDVYRNNVVVSLVAALADTFPVVQQLVGGEFFEAMVRLYICESPPTSPVLTDYGDGFADWVHHFEPATTLPYLADMARLERARVRAFHAADIEPVPPQAWQAVLSDPSRLVGCSLSLHPSLAIVHSAYALVSLWQAHQHDNPDTIDAAVAAVTLDHAEQALVWRDGDAVLVQPVAPTTAAFVLALRAGQPLGTAIEQLAGAELAAPLGLLVGHRLVTHIQSNGEQP
ncbi:HvfC/BufC N-terminal domain-containing protein [Rubrivivax albus]|uniref:DUF2063 domain-containing protein n=1 Tax=Rubrivivax albus TaxID=2499835 RepID=A0A3S2U6Z1_9BURK|nr:DNA-binding domain-containing protein [Rubrivivax albus]RVT49624.1 DUF2063 domain-containing protein [Rubrivivax albus]